ncbi:MAG: hypothetical protein B6245_05850 [Desulfobacteraceae bacterium 4572_88]|nr:MAG: hypothetical protein B6245_05850 [Desulfobacteraceae bacterium 4572_88]
MKANLVTKTRKINEILETVLGFPEKKAKHADPLESLILTILSQNTNDINSFRAFESLNVTYSRPDEKADWARIAADPRKNIAKAIRIGGLANQKSETIQNILNWLKQEYGDYDLGFLCDMDPWEAVPLFTQHKGIGVKTISVVLCFSCGADIFPVDTHVNRICHRLGLVDAKFNAEKTFRAMQELVPPNKSFSLHLNMIRLGREICQSRKPKCQECPLAGECEHIRTQNQS